MKELLQDQQVQMLKIMNTEQNETPTTTDPRKPDGKTPTHPPLSVNSQVATTENSSSRIRDMSLSEFNGLPIYWERFSITSSQAPNAGVFNFQTKNLFKEISSLKNLPFQMLEVLFSQRNTYKIKLMFVPIKLGESPVILDFFYQYRNIQNIPVDIGKRNLDYDEITVVNQEPFEVEVPHYYLFDQVNTWFKTTDLDYLPNTEVHVKIKSPYVPTMLHPTSFDMLVFVKVEFRCSEKFIPNIEDLKNFVFQSYDYELNQS